MFYQWLCPALCNLGAALGPPASDAPGKRENELVARTEALEAKLAKQPRGGEAAPAAGVGGAHGGLAERGTPRPSSFCPISPRISRAMLENSSADFPS